MSVAFFYSMCPILLALFGITTLFSVFYSEISNKHLKSVKKKWEIYLCTLLLLLFITFISARMEILAHSKFKSILNVLASIYKFYETHSSILRISFLFSCSILSSYVDMSFEYHHAFLM